MTPKARATGGNLISTTAVNNVTASPMTACRSETARRFSPRAQPIAGNANPPNADCSCGMIPPMSARLWGQDHPPRSGAGVSGTVRARLLAPADERQLGSHHCHEQYARIERQGRHIGDRLADRLG